VFGNASGSIADLAVDPNNNSVLYVAAYSSGCGPGLGATPCGLLKSADAGKTWQSVLADDCANVVVDPRNGNVYAGCYLAGTATIKPSGEVAKSTDGGKTFTKLSSGLTRLGVYPSRESWESTRAAAPFSRQAFSSVWIQARHGP
jgi:hypothetical protein